MKFLIRDDDISFLTQVDKLRFVWGWLLDQENTKINLAVIPFVECGEFSKVETGVRSLDENRELVDFLRRGAGQGKIEVMLHGFDHASSQQGFEFQSGAERELTEKISKGRKYLEELLGVKVAVFVPPHNSISSQGIAAVRNNGMHLLGAFPALTLCSGLSLGWQAFFLKRYIYSLRRKKALRGRFFYPFKNLIKTLAHLDCYPFIPGQMNAEGVKCLYDAVKQDDGILCLSVHHWEMDGHNISELIQAVEYIMRDKSAEFSFACEALGESRVNV